MRWCGSNFPEGSDCEGVEEDAEVIELDSEVIEGVLLWPEREPSECATVGVSDCDASVFNDRSSDGTVRDRGRMNTDQNGVPFFSFSAFAGEYVSTDVVLGAVYPVAGRIACVFTDLWLSDRWLKDEPEREGRGRRLIHSVGRGASGCMISVGWTWGRESVFSRGLDCARGIDDA